MTNNSIESMKIAVVIFARNESSVIQRTVENISAALRSTDQLFVVADNCSDETANLASDAGANVMIRKVVEPQGKGAALVWFMHFYKSQILEYNYMVILDADSLIPIDFFDKVQDLLISNIDVAQCYLAPIDFEASPLSTLIALSDIIEQTVFDRVRSSLGCSVRLRGTGMIFRPQFLLSLCSRIKTEVEDIALSLMVAERKIKVEWLPSLVVFDPKPTEQAAATRQRARWFRGQWAAFWNYRSIIFPLVLRGPAGWSVIGPLFLKPRWLKVIMLLIIGFVFLWQPLISTVVFLLVGLEFLFFLVGICVVPNRKQFLKSLLYIPSFILMWVKSILLSLKNRPWLRVRKTQESTDQKESNILPFLNSKDIYVK